MRAHNVIIITSGQGHLAGTGSLDRAIRKIVDQAKNPILVLGPEGDDFLRDCELIEHCDLVFDPNFEGQMFSSVKAGLHATNGAAFVLPLGHALPLDQAWEMLEKTLGVPDSPVEADVLCLDPCPRSTTQGDSSPLFLVTARGVENLRKLPANTEWTANPYVATRYVSFEIERAFSIL